MTAKRELNEQQEFAVLAAGRDLAVGAGAGSGKTRVLTERFVDLVHRREVPIDRVATISFTEKAAAEMKTRIARRLSEIGRMDLRRRVDDAYISTVHGFCRRLLREFALDVPLDPDSAVLDDMDARQWWALLADEMLETQEGFRDLAEELGTDAAVGAMRAGVGFWRLHGWTPAVVRRLAAVSFKEYRRMAGEMAEPRRSRFITDLKNAASGLSRVETLKGKAAAGLQEFLRSVQALMPDAPAGGDDLRRLRELIKSRGARWSKKDVPPDQLALREHVADALLRDHAWLFDELMEDDRATFSLRRSFLAVGARAWERFQAEKRQAATMDFADMETYGLDLVLRLRDLIRGRFDHVLMDEFQDTSPIQWKLVDALRPRGGGDSGETFVVGDERQSIYRFRGAAPEDMRQVARSLGRAEEEPHDLRANYRSRPEILSFIAGAFTRAWDGDPDAPDPRMQPAHPRYQPDEPGAPPRVEVIIVPQRPMEKRDAGEAASKRPRVEPLDSARVRETAFVAARLKRLLRVEKPRVFDENAKEFRPVRYGDIAVLVRTRGSFDVYTRVFSRFSIPVRALEGRGYYDRLEVHDLVALLSVVENPMQDVPLAAVLRSPLVGVGDDALLALAKGRLPEDSGWRAVLDRESVLESLDLADARRVRDFVLLLEHLRARRWSHSPARLLETALARTRYVEKTLAEPGGRARAANVRKLVELARAFTAGAGGLGAEESGAGGFARMVGRLRDAETLETDAPTGREDDDVVRVMTVHRAKGLEFPVVVVGDMGARFRSLEGRVTFSKTFGALIKNHDPEKNKNYRTFTQCLESEEQTDQERAERLRLFYVACTRAREFLLLAGVSEYKPPKDSGKRPAQWRSWADLLLGILDHPGAPAHNPVDERGEEIPREKIPARAVDRVLTLGAGRVRFIEKLADKDMRPSPVAERSLADMDPANMRAVAKGARDTLLLPVETSGKTADVSDADAGHATDDYVSDADDKAVVQRLLSPPVLRATPAKITISQIADYERCPLFFHRRHTLLQPTCPPRSGTDHADSTPSDIENDRPRETAADDFSPTDLGSFVHRVLERADLRAENLERELSAVAARLVVGNALSPDMEVEAAPMLRAFAGSDLAARLRDARVIVKERRFALSVGAMDVVGVLDLAAVFPSGETLVLDYKTDRVGAKDAPDHAGRYYRQCRAYAAALARSPLRWTGPNGETLAGEPPDYALLYFLRPGTEVRVPVDAEAAWSQLRDLAVGVATGNRRPHPEAPCETCAYHRYGDCHREQEGGAG